jgi:lipoprotein LpqB-like beta-propeller protein/sporulation and spore germination protein
MSRAGRVPAVLLAVLVVLTACSTVPDSSPTVRITQAAERPTEHVGIEPLSPDPGATPEEIVRNFIDAAASAVPGHPVAREYLAPAQAGKWSDEAGITVISPDYAIVATDSGTVQVTANLVGTVDPRGVFSVAAPGVFTREFTLAQFKKEWRITDPPDGLLILQPDFQRLYDERNAYFLDVTGQRVVPDPRYLITGGSQPTALVERLLAGPSAGLAAGVRNPLSGVRLRRTVTVDRQAATVDLTGLATDPAPVLSEVSAQLVWTLDQLPIRTVEVLVDGEPVNLDRVPAQQTVDDWASFNPDAVPADAVGHYLDRGVLRTATEGKPAPGPAGKGTYGLSGAAVWADPRNGSLSYLTGVQTAGGRATLLAGSYGGQLKPVLTAGSLTAPSVAATRAEAWVVRDGTGVVRVPAGGGPQEVSTPTLVGLGRALVLKLSPDAVRAALVVDGPEGPTLYLSTVVRAEDGAVALRDFRQVAPSLSHVVDVAWQDSGRLLVLAGDAAQNRMVPYSVGIDGFDLTAVPTSGLPGQPTAIGAAPARQPLVSANGTLWQLGGGTWVTLVRGAEPLSGTAPFYPI